MYDFLIEADYADERTERSWVAADSATEACEIVRADPEVVAARVLRSNGPFRN